jgi:hypothetical protein
MGSKEVPINPKIGALSTLEGSFLSLQPAVYSPPPPPPRSAPRSRFYEALDQGRKVRFAGVS